MTQKESSKTTTVLTIAGTSRGNTVELIQLDNIVNRLGVSRSRRSSDILGKTSVQRCLSSLKSRSGGSAGTSLLSTHTKATGSSLSSRNTTSLALFALTRTGRRLQVVQGEFKIVQIVNGRFIGGPTFPVKQFHGQSRRGTTCHTGDGGRPWNKGRKTICARERGIEKGSGC